MLARLSQNFTRRANTPRAAREADTLAPHGVLLRLHHMEHASFRHRPLEQAFVRALAGIGIDPGENGKPQAQSGQHHHVLTERHHARADEHEMAGRRYSYPAERTTADTVRESTFSEMSLDRRREALALRQTRAATVDDPWLARLQRRWDESDPAKAGSTHIEDSRTTGASHDSQALRHHQYAESPAHHYPLAMWSRSCHVFGR